MSVQSPQYDKPRGISGGSSVWDYSDVWHIINDDYFDTSITFNPATVQTKTFANTGYVNVTTIAPNSPFQAHNQAFLIVSSGKGSENTATSVTDTQSNTWELLSSASSSAYGGDIWVCRDLKAGTPTITINLADYYASTLILREYSGLGTDFIVNGLTKHTDTGYVNTHAMGPTSVTQAPALSVAVYFGNDKATTYTTPSGYAHAATANNPGGSTFDSSWIADKYLTATGTESFTLNTSTFVQGAGILFAIVGVPNIPPETEPTTDLGRLESVFLGWRNRYMREDGAIVRPTNEGNGDTTNGYAPHEDVVSEGMAYALIYEVQLATGTQERFDLIEQWCYDNMDRRNYTGGDPGNNAPSDALNLMAYHYNPTLNNVFDWAAAYDADIDRAKALLWAHAKWTSGGTIDYLTRALAILQDLVDYGLREGAFDHQWYMVSGSGNMSISEPEMNNSYLDPAAFKLFAQYDTDNKDRWASAVDSSYAIIKKTAETVLTNPAAPGDAQTTTAYLPANWVTLDFTTGEVSPLSASYRDTNYTYDAFRQNYRLYLDTLFHEDDRAIARRAEVETFLDNEWTTNGLIYAEYFHDGAVKETYESRMFYAAAWFITPTSVYDSKLESSYVFESNNSYYDNSVTNTGDIGYYSQSWLLFYAMLRLNQFQNYGAESWVAGGINRLVGAEWNRTPVKYNSGAGWVKVPRKRWDGTAWVYGTVTKPIIEVVETFYFDGHNGISDPATKWNNDSSAFDGNFDTTMGGSTYAFAGADEIPTSISSGFLQGLGTTAPSSGGAISQVRIRMLGGYGSPLTTRATVFTSDLSEELGETSVASGNPPAFGSYVILTPPTGGWTWSALNTLAVKFWYDNVSDLYSNRASGVELEVTHT